MPRMFRLVVALISLIVIASTMPSIAGAYTVKAGDTPIGIAKKHGISVHDLLKANKGLKPSKMRVGQNLTIPGSGGSKKHPDKTDHKGKSTEKSTRTTSRDRNTGHKTSTKTVSTSHTVKKGETLSGIAAKYGVSIHDLQKANKGLNRRHIHVGQKLTIPGGAKAEQASEPKHPSKSKAERSESFEPETTVYTAHRHDTPKSVARKYHISTKELHRLNPGMGQRIHKGQKLIVPAVASRSKQVSEPEQPVVSAGPAPTPAPERTTPTVETPTPRPNTPTLPSRKAMGEAEVLFEKGIEFGKQNKFPKAVESFDKAIRLNPNRADYYASRGHAHYYMKQYAKAIADYTVAIEKNPGFALAYSMRGLSLTRSGKYNEAIKDFNKAITLGPNEADYYKGRGFTYLHLKQSGPMCRDYQKACDLGDCELLESARKEKACP